MNVLMIHGIGQEDSTQAELIEKWSTALQNASPGLLDNSDYVLPYYGTILADWANGKTNSAVGMGTNTFGIDTTDSHEMNFLSQSLEQIVKEKGVTEAQIEAADLKEGNQAIAMDNWLYRRINALLRVIEDLSPAKGKLLLRLIKQGNTYLSSPGAAADVDEIVKPYLLRSPQVLITHSLGTVIAFKLLREMEEQNIEIEIPLLITMGSPLGLEAFKAKLGPPFKKPKFVTKWKNFYDPSDFVTLGKPLDKDNFGPGIENEGIVDNDTFNAHGVVQYLPHKGVIDELKLVLM